MKRLVATTVKLVPVAGVLARMKASNVGETGASSSLKFRAALSCQPFPDFKLKD